jgi:hypothetical protein
VRHPKCALNAGASTARIHPGKATALLPNPFQVSTANPHLPAQLYMQCPGCTSHIIACRPRALCASSCRAVGMGCAAMAKECSSCPAKRDSPGSSSVSATPSLSPARPVRPTLQQRQRHSRVVFVSHVQPCSWFGELCIVLLD